MIPIETPRRTAWLAGTLLGVVNAFGVFYLAVAGMILALLGVAVIAWKGPRLPAFAGLVTGVGFTWTMLFGNADNDLIRWAGAAEAILAVGLLATIVAARRR